MIVNARSDCGLAELCAGLKTALVSACDLRPWDVPAPAGACAHPVSRARDGLAWVLAASDIGPGDEVLVPALTCPVVAHAIVKTGAHVATYGLTPETFLPSAQSCEAAISPEVKALIVPHLFGTHSPMREFRELADARGLLLIEDAAHLAPIFEGRAQDLAGDCALYSFNIAKPVSLGWGGLVVLSHDLAGRLGRPMPKPMSQGDDRFYAAAFLLLQAATESQPLPGPPLSLDFAVRFLASRTKDGGPSHDVRAILEAAASNHPAEALRRWCDVNSPAPRRSAVTCVAPEIKLPLKRVAAELRGAKTAPLARAVPESFLRETLPTAGLSMMLLQIQAESPQTRRWREEREHLATVYVGVLDPERWLTPQPKDAQCWLSLPLSSRREISPERRDRISRTVARRLGIDIYPYLWPEALPQIPRLRRVLRAGPGSEKAGHLVDGLFNLPLHSQVSESTARDLAELLNTV